MSAITKPSRALFFFLTFALVLATIIGLLISGAANPFKLVDPGAVVRWGLPIARSVTDIAMATTLEQGALQVQPVFCLLKASLIESLVAFLDSGQRKIDRWTAGHRCVSVTFDDAAAFFNANTLEELAQLQRR